MIHDNNTLAIAVCPVTADQYAGAQALAAKLGIPLTQEDTEEFKLLLM